VLSPTAFLERLCALIPRPRRPLITYHGVLAPAARLRPAIVPTPENPEPTCSHEPKTRASSPKPRRPKRRGQRRYYRWAELPRTVFLIDVLVCPRCNGRRRVVNRASPDSSTRTPLPSRRHRGNSGGSPERTPLQGPPPRPIRARTGRPPPGEPRGPLLCLSAGRRSDSTGRTSRPSFRTVRGSGVSRRASHPQPAAPSGPDQSSR